MGENAFELSIPPFLGLHPVFNVDRLRPYFPPLLDTSDIAEQLTPTELNPACMEQVSTDRIMDTQIKHTRQHNIQLYRVVKAGKLLHQGKWLTRAQVQQKFPHLMEKLNAMGTIASFVSFSFLVSLFAAQFTIFGSFSGPKHPEPF